MSNIEVKDYSVQELEQILKEKKEKQRKQREKEQKDYEAHRDKTIYEIMEEALRLNEQITYFKEKVHKIMEAQAEKLQSYGAIRSNSKGGFSITDSTNQYRVIRRRDTHPTWDERATKGVELIKGFLNETVKKRDKKLFEILMSFLEKNQDGDLEYAKVMNLLKHEDKFSDQRWREGLGLIKEGYMVTMQAYGYEFKRTAGDGSWENILLNFSSI
jgi:hypothetical protein